MIARIKLALANRRLAKTLQPKPKSPIHVMGWQTRRKNDEKRRAKIVATARQLASQIGRGDLVERLQG